MSSTLNLDDEAIKALLAFIAGLVGGWVQGRLKERRDRKNQARIEALQATKATLQALRANIVETLRSSSDIEARRSRNGEIVPIALLNELQVYGKVATDLLTRRITREYHWTTQSDIRAVTNITDALTKTSIYAALFTLSRSEVRNQIETRAYEGDSTDSDDEASVSATAQFRDLMIRVAEEPRGALEDLRSAVDEAINMTLRVEYAFRGALSWSAVAPS